MRILAALLLVPSIAICQVPFPSACPSEATTPTAETLKQRLTGKSFVAKPVVGSEFRIEYQEVYAFINIGGASDSGRWHTEGSSVCVDWRTFPPACSEARFVGDLVYIKRSSNGEIIPLRPK